MPMLPNRLKEGAVLLLVQCFLRNVQASHPHPGLVKVDLPTLMSQYHQLGGYTLNAMYGREVASYLDEYFGTPQTFHYESSDQAIHGTLAEFSFSSEGRVDINGRVFSKVDGKEVKPATPKLHMRAVSIRGVTEADDRTAFRDIIRNTLLDMAEVPEGARVPILERDQRKTQRAWVKLWIDPKLARQYQDYHNAMVAGSPHDGYFTVDLYEEMNSEGVPHQDHKVGTLQLTPSCQTSEGRCVFEYLLEVLYLSPKD